MCCCRSRSWSCSSLILNYLGPSGFNIFLAVAFASASTIIRIVRGLTLDIKTRDYVAAAQTRGERPCTS